MRAEYIQTFTLAGGRTLSVILRDTLVPEDPYINMARATALSIRTGEPYDSDRVDRTIKDYLIKTNISS
jgi:hypothetical protein